MNAIKLTKLAVLAACVTSVSNATAASISVGSSYTLAAQNHPSNTSGEGVPYYISVNSTNAGFGGKFNTVDGTSNTADTPFTVGFTHDVQDYHFMNELRVSNSPRLSAIRTVVEPSGGTSITMTTSDTNFDGFGQDGARIWENTDPGSVANLLTATNQNYTGGIGVRDITNVSGSVDITGLASGTLWFFYGGYNNTPSITGTMTGGTSGDIAVGNAHGGDTANRQQIYAASFDFVNDEGYNNIDYAYTTGSRWVGMVLTGTTPVPEPSSLALLGLGGLCMLRSRRR